MTGCSIKLSRYTIEMPPAAPALLPTSAMPSPSRTKALRIWRRRAPMLLRMPICLDFCSTDTITIDAMAKADATRLKAEMRYADAVCISGIWGSS